MPGGHGDLRIFALAATGAGTAEASDFAKIIENPDVGAVVQSA
jgi:hypothetical protein